MLENDYTGDACEDLLADNHDSQKYRCLGRWIPGLGSVFPHVENQ
jgi:hypothetical protein